jgi:hypothetical protein
MQLLAQIFCERLVRSATQLPHWSTFHRRTPCVCTIQKFSAIRTSTFIGRCTSGIERPDVDTTRWSTALLRHGGYYIPKSKVSRKVDWTRRPCNMVTPFPDLSPLDFSVWGFFKSCVYRRGKPEASEQMVARIQDAFEGFRNDFPRFPWQYSIDRRLAACTEAGGGHFENILD